MTNRKVLFVTTVSATIKGFLIPYARHFRKKGWTVVAVANGVTPQWEAANEFDANYGMQWSRSPFDLISLINAISRLRKILKDERPDIVHCHTPIAAFICRLTRATLIKHPIPKILYTAHGFHFISTNPWYKNLIFIALEKIAGIWTDHIIVINNDDYNNALKYKIISKDQLTHVKGVGIEKNYLKNSNASSSLNSIITPGVFTFVFVAEYTPNKRHIDLIDAAKIIGDKYNYQVILIGAGQLLNEIEDEIHTNNLSTKIKIAGHQTDVSSFYQRADCSLLLSLREGLPRSLMEAMFYSLPIIATDIRGNNELVDDDNGCLINTADPKQLAEAMINMINDPQKAKAKGRKGRSKLEPYFFENVIQDVEKIYLSLAENT